MQKGDMNWTPIYLLVLILAVIAGILLIIVAGSILVIILSMLGGFVTSGGSPVTVMAQAVQSVRGAPGSGTVSTQVVQFQKGQVISSTAIETKAGVNPGTVHFCMSGVSTENCQKNENTICPDNYKFDSEDKSNYFDTRSIENGIKANQKIGGKIWVYNCDGEYYIGFTSKGV